MRTGIFSTDFTPDIRMSNRRRSWDRWLFFCLCISLLAHFGFLYTSIYWKVGGLGSAEKTVETLFKVQISNLESQNFLSRPNQEQLLNEREQILAQELVSLNQQNLPVLPAGVESGIEALTPPSQSETPPTWGDSEADRLIESDPISQRLITSDFGQNTVQSIDDLAGIGAIQDEISNNRIPLSGRSSGSQGRLMMGLPEPAMDRAPIAGQSLQDVLSQPQPPSSPNLDVSGPSIALPPITTLLPTPDLLNPSPESVDLESVEEAKEEIKERFINLDDLLQVDLQTYHHVGGDGYFMVRIRPIAVDERLRVLPKDVVFVLDASSSMGKRRMPIIIGELEKLLTRLRAEDRFNIVGFKQRVRQFTQTLIPVSTETIQEAKRFLRPLEASGKTDIYTSLEPLVQLGTERARPLILFLVSDGRPTVGVVNSRKIINSLSKYQGPSSSIFCVGTGDIINRYLLDMLAFRNRGLVAFEELRSDLPPVIESLYGYIEDPVLLQVNADFLGIDKSEIYPKSLPHLFLKGEIRIWGRLRDETHFTLRLVGEAFDEKKEIVLDLPIPERDNGTYEIARQWAFHKIYDIVGKMVEEGEQAELLDQIRFLSRSYRIVTPYSEQFEGK